MHKPDVNAKEAIDRSVSQVAPSEAYLCTIESLTRNVATNPGYLALAGILSSILTNEYRIGYFSYFMIPRDFVAFSVAESLSEGTVLLVVAFFICFIGVLFAYLTQLFPTQVDGVAAIIMFFGGLFLAFFDFSVNAKTHLSIMVALFVIPISILQAVVNMCIKKATGVAKKPTYVLSLISFFFILIAFANVFGVFVALNQRKFAVAKLEGERQCLVIPSHSTSYFLIPYLAEPQLIVNEFSLVEREILPKPITIQSFAKSFGLLHLNRHQFEE